MTLDLYLRQNWHTTRTIHDGSTSSDFRKRKELLLKWAAKAFPHTEEKAIAEAIDEYYPHPEGWKYGYPRTLKA